jgi:branched-subunit amino acid transport protein
MAEIWLILLAAGLLTYLIRLSFIALLGKWSPPAWMGRALRFVPPAVLTAIIFPELLIRDNHVLIVNPRLLAGIVAAGIAWRTKNVILTITVGMAVLLFIQALWPG